MRLEVLGPFSTTVTAGGDQHRIVGIPGAILDVDETIAAGLLRVVAPYVREVCPAVAVFDAINAGDAETVAEEPVVEMVEVPPEIAPQGRTRQIARKPAKPGPKPTAKGKKK